MKLEISKLMDHYTDTEFCPREGEFVDAEAVRDRVLAQAAPTHRKKRWGTKLLLVAAALAACVGVMAAGRAMVRYVSPTGAVLAGGDGTSYAKDSDAELVVLEEGRLWFVADGQHVDITDLVDESTAYTYVVSDPNTGATSSIIAGGTPEDFGWCEIFEGPGAGSMGGGENFIVNYVNMDGELVNYSDLNIPEEQEVEFFQSHEITLARKGWYADGLVKLGLSDPYGPVE